MRSTLADFFVDLAKTPGEFLVYDDGLKTERRSYADLAATASRFAERLHDARLAKGDAVLFWSENRPEWIAAFWACVVSGVVVVPIDFRSSAEFAGRVATIVNARLALVGDDVRSAALGGVEAWPLAGVEWEKTRHAVAAANWPAPPSSPLAPDDVAEIIFTSGATAEPTGVIITHRNILANIVPIEREVAKYRAWGRPFFPLRFLDLLPLSHMFGQAMATFIPPMLPGTTVFMRGFNPAAIVAQVRKRRISVVVCVPKILDVLGEHARRTWPDTVTPGAAPGSVARRWWRYRAAHRAFGWKFWSFVVGAAPLEPATEAFWSRLGFAVIQGYGLTETAPIVSLNHPFASRKGSVGKAIPGVEVQIAPDGEILVRGPNVTRGYVGGEPGTSHVLDDGWLHTGDIGEVDADGRLFVRGRKKEMIVTPDGMNVFPEDVERVINGQPGVRESAVVGATRDGEERVHAVLVLEPGTDPERVVRQANATLADHQRIRGVSTWPRDELPRTEGTRKVMRREVRRWVEAGTGTARAPEPAGARPDLDSLLARYAGGREIRADTTIEELGLGSLDRVELLAALDERLDGSVDEERFAEARTVADLRALVGQASGLSSASGVSSTSSPPADDQWTMPAWSRGRIMSAIRRASQSVALLPLTRVFARLEVGGLDHLRGLEGPVIFAANHQSHLDTPVILAALPARWRRRVAVAMSKDYFAPYFHPLGRGRVERVRSGLLYGLAVGLFNAFPLPQHEAGARRTLRHIGDLVSDGWSVLIFPEGRRGDTDAVGPFKPGVAMVAARLSVPVVPVRLEGVGRVLPRGSTRPHQGRVRVRFGPAVRLTGADYGSLARRVEEAVRGT
jgi:long-chain acyl-CoA synthetase